MSWQQSSSYLDLLSPCNASTAPRIRATAPAALQASHLVKVVRHHRKRINVATSQKLSLEKTTVCESARDAPGYQLVLNASPCFT
eukprot:COSAG06_NODE_1864_length_8194_cov_4.258431_8_plen_85_part_00